MALVSMTQLWYIPGVNGFSVARVVCEADIQLVAPLFDAYRVFYGQPADANASVRFLHDRWVASESVVFYAHEDSVAAIGFVQLYPSFLSDKMLRFWILNDLFVAPSSRSRGVARALMRRSQRHALETQSGGLTLSTAIDNVTAQSLYESEGYERDRGFVYYNNFLPTERP